MCKYLISNIKDTNFYLLHEGNGTEKTGWGLIRQGLFYYDNIFDTGDLNCIYCCEPVMFLFVIFAIKVGSAKLTKYKLCKIPQSAFSSTDHPSALSGSHST